MVSDKRSGARGAGKGPHPVELRPGSVNRGFASLDPERQREAATGGCKAAPGAGKVPEATSRPARAARAPASGGARPRGGRGSRDEPAGGDEEGGAS